MKTIKNPKWDVKRQNNRNTHLDWDKLTDGKCYELTKGEGKNDFRSHPATFGVVLRNVAISRGLKVRVTYPEGTLDTVRFQFVPAPKKRSR